MQKFETSQVLKPVTSIGIFLSCLGEAGLLHTEDGIELVSRVGELGERLGCLPKVLVVVEEVDGAVVLEHLYARGVERSNSTLGGCEGQLGASLDEDIVGVCKLRLERGGGLLVLALWRKAGFLYHEGGLTRYYSGSLAKQVQDISVTSRVSSVY